VRTSVDSCESIVREVVPCFHDITIFRKLIFILSFIHVEERKQGSNFVFYSVRKLKR